MSWLSQWYCGSGIRSNEKDEHVTILYRAVNVYAEATHTEQIAY